MKKHADLQLQNTDLVSGVYEGGFKLWECSIDLTRFLIEQNVQVQNKNVLEIGCGAGIPGIYCLQNGAHVQFQDYVS